MKFFGEEVSRRDFRSDISSEKVTNELISIFNNNKGRILVTGKPGSGKTTLLFKLAFELIHEEEKKIPIIINIATWRNRFHSVEDWLEELLPQMGFSKGLVAGLLNENLLLPLFDGLDELREEDRKICLKAIGRYGLQHKVKYVISSRKKEYDAINHRAPVFCEVMVKPLSIQNIKTELKEIDSPESKGILNAIEQDELLMKAIKTPFYLNTVQLLFASMAVWKDFNFMANNVKGRKREIVERFIENALESIRGYEYFSLKKKLAFWANLMNQKGMVSFELLDLQYDSWPLSKYQVLIGKLIYGFLLGLILGLSGGLVGGLTGGFVGDLGKNPQDCILAGLAFGLFGGVVFGWVYGKRGHLVVGLFYGLIVALVGGLIVGLQYDLGGGLLVGLLGGLVFGSVGGITYGLVKGQPKIYTKERVRLSFYSYFSSIKKDIIRFTILGLGLGLVVGIVLVYFLEIYNGFLIGLIGGGVGGIIVGLVVGMVKLINTAQSYLKIINPYQRFRASMFYLHFSILQHLHLKYVLFKKDLLPWNLVRFLNEATKNNILESNGGSWRFRHRILQDYFANLWEAEYAAKYDTGKNKKI